MLKTQRLHFLSPQDLSKMTMQTSCPVTTLFARSVPSESASAYESWLNSVVETANNAPGILETKVIRPEEDSGNYVSIVQFDSQQSYQRWFDSEVRAQSLSKLSNMNLECQEASSWSILDNLFSGPNNFRAPPRYKSALVVLLGLYPLVLLLTLFWNPLVVEWPLPLRVLTSLAISVSLMSWGILPILNRCLSFWLRPSVTSAKKEGRMKGAV